VREVLELVGLAGHADRYPHELSGGERQRVALARALAPSPSLMLLDEPGASLDPNLRSQIRRDVVRILREADTPAVFVTHDQAEALAVADRIAVMRSGQVVQVGTPEDVFHRPNSRFVASLMGEAAFLPVVDVDGELVTPIGSRCDRDELRGRRPDEVVAMVRPDDVSVRPADGGDAEIVGAEFRGSTWAYTLRLASGDLAQALASHLEGHLAVGTRVTACPVPGHTPTLLDGA
jgi:iron(III) transport system ATP-binding protein